MDDNEWPEKPDYGEWYDEVIELYDVMIACAVADRDFVSERVYAPLMYASEEYGCPLKIDEYYGGDRAVLNSEEQDRIERRLHHSPTFIVPVFTEAYVRSADCMYVLQVACEQSQRVGYQRVLPLMHGEFDRIFRDDTLSDTWIFGNEADVVQVSPGSVRLLGAEIALRLLADRLKRERIGLAQARQDGADAVWPLRRIAELEPSIGKIAESLKRMSAKIHEE
jgi:hypothetical protein